MRNSRSNAFTLVELLIVIGIIAVLVAFLLPAVYKAMSSGSRARTMGDLQTIAMGLEAYKQDFGDIPRLPTFPIGTPAPNFAGNPMDNTGAAILGKAMLGPFGDGFLPSPPAAANTPDPGDPPTYQPTGSYHAGDCVTYSGNQWLAVKDSTNVTPSSGIPEWQSFTATDNSDGPGFKTRLGASQVHGPYVQPGKLKNQGVFLLDHNGSPILYFPARLGSVNIGTLSASGPQPYVDFNPPATLMTSLYDASDNSQAFCRLPGETLASNGSLILNRERIMLGNYTCTGYIDPTKGDVAVNQPYLLWAAGPDGMFGPTGYTPDPTNPIANQKAVSNCDDVTNFK